MSTQDLSPEQLKATETILKLLALAANAGTPEEAATANSKAQDLLIKHNLDAAMLEDPKAVKREKAAVEGGSYAFERTLWRAVAELNFCVYQNQKYLSDPVMTDVWSSGRGGVKQVYLGRELRRQARRRHLVVGRAMNARTTISMAGYLRQAIERVLGEELKVRKIEKQSNWAWSFRKGCAYTIVDKLKARREEILQAEKSEIKKMMEEAATSVASGISSSTALTVAGFTKSEEDANNDFLYGEGFSARVAARRAAEAERRRKMSEDYTKWCAANPKKAMSQFRWEDPTDGRVYYYAMPRGGGPGSRGGQADNLDNAAFSLGLKAGENVGLDQQAEGKKDAPRIAGSKDIYL